VIFPAGGCSSATDHRKTLRRDFGERGVSGREERIGLAKVAAMVGESQKNHEEKAAK